MPYKTRIYSPMVNAEIKTNILLALDEATDEDMPTTEWLRAHSIPLTPITPQKISRSLNELWEMGLVKKAKSRRLNRMVYRLTSKMEEAGYDD